MTHSFKQAFIYRLLVSCLLSSLPIWQAGVSYSLAYAEDIDITTYYPAPYAAYKEIQVQNQNEDTDITKFTQNLTQAGIHIITDYTANAYTPGIFWSTLVNNPDKPKAGIWMQEASDATAGSKLFFGTSNNYLSGITNLTSVMILNHDGNLGIGTTAPKQQLELTANLRLPPTTPDVGSYFSGEDRFLHNFGTENTFLGIRSGNVTMTGVGHNTGVGYEALKSNTTGDSNTAVGANALYTNETGDSNTALGRAALYKNFDGNSNTASGCEALYSNIDGDDNSALGYRALWSNTGGNGNTAIGADALFSTTTGDGNTAAGHEALYSNVEGDENVALGHRALNKNVTGSYNVAVGAYAGEKALGSHNIFLGYQAGQNETGSNKLYIANNATTPLIYGDFSADTLEINGYLGVGIAPSDTGYRLTLPNTDDKGGRGIANEWISSSSLRWKENITPIPNALEKVQHLRGVYYHHKQSKKREVGMIAEEVGKVFPEIVDYEKNGTDAIGMSYDRLTAVLVEAVKELKAENQVLKKRMIVLKENIKT